ncbi:MAG: hypothetical protein HY203_09285 [Nitrospirae bacterium]|nr:hypothetical protein [Nitrospirota bacterium]
MITRSPSENRTSYNCEIHHRRSVRLKAHDYSQPGAYFVTICTQNRECVFGKILNTEMILNDAGRMVQGVWDELPVHYPGVQIDSFVIMPNHIHGIIVLTGSTPHIRHSMSSSPGEIGLRGSGFDYDSVIAQITLWFLSC